MNVRVFRSIEEVPADFGPCALTIGNFDGVHLGHRVILRRVKELAASKGWKAAAMTFDPHPAEIVAPHRAPKLMSTPERRAELMAEEGIEEVLILPFTRQLAALSAEAFVESVLLDRLQARAVLVGHNFRFGYRQSGDSRSLEQLGTRHGFAVEVSSEVKRGLWTVSSTAIREAVEAGDLTKARRMLCRPFSLDGQVVSGRGIGSKQTVPTLNLQSDTPLLPRPGVYVTRTRDLRDNRRWPSVTNVGWRPTFQGEDLTVETFLLSDLDGQTPERIRVEFLKRLRDEKRFDSAEQLRTQIMNDVQRARRLFVRLARLAPVTPDPVSN